MIGGEQPEQVTVRECVAGVAERPRRASVVLAQLKEELARALCVPGGVGVVAHRLPLSALRAGRFAQASTTLVAAASDGSWPRSPLGGIPASPRSLMSVRQYGRLPTPGRTLVPTSPIPDVPGVSWASVPTASERERGGIPPSSELAVQMRGTRTMSVKSKAMKTLAVATAAGALTVGGATAAFAADGSSTSSGTSGETATVPQRLRNRPVRQALRTAFGAAADTLGTSAKDLRDQMVQNHESLASV